MDFSTQRIQVTARPPRRSRRYVFFLEERTWDQDASERLLVSGWVVHSKHEIVEVRLLDGKRVLASSAVDQHRSQVSDRFAGYPNAERSGFELELPSPGLGTYRLRLLTRTGKVIRAGRLELHPQKQPRLVFMHIPKAAGSTLNHWLASHYRKSRYEVHIESQGRWRSDPKQYRELDFVSGHVPVGRLGRHFDLEQDYLVTVVREPFAQLASHLAWIRRLSDAGEEHRFAAHPAFAQGLSRKLLKIELSDAEALDSLVGQLEQSEIRLLDNCQVRYFCNLPPEERVTAEHLQKAIENFRLFDRIGVADRLSDFMNDVARDMHWRIPKKVLRQNVSASYYGLNIGDPATRRALEPLVHFDLQLYAAVASR
jgi:hypothetical protein